MNNAAAEALLSLIGEAREHLRELRSQVDDPASLVERYCDQLDNIATTAELAGMADVESETADNISTLKKVLERDESALNEEFERLENWADSLYKSLQIPAAAGNSLLLALADEFQEHIVGLPDALREQPDAIVPVQLALAQRFRLACETLGVHSLCTAFGLLEDNLTQLQSGEPSAQQTTLLSRWPGLVQAYLHRGDESTAAEFVGVLEDAGWPQPLQETAAKRLLVDLADVAEQPGELEQERLVTADAEHVSLQLPQDLTAELLDAFFQESPAQATELSERLQHVAAGVDVDANVRAAQRLAHTLKGAGNLTGASGVANIAHYLEDILEQVQNGGESVSAALGEVIQDAADCLEAMIDALLGHAEPPGNAVEVLQKMLDYAPSQDSAIPLIDAETPDANTEPDEPAPESRQETPEVTQYMRIATGTVDEMFRMAGEVTIGMAQIQDRIRRLLGEGENLRSQDLVLQKARLELENQVGVRGIAAAQRQTAIPGQDGFDSLEMDRYDSLYGSAHTFIEAAVDLREMSMDLQGQLQRLDSLLGNQQSLNSELQDVILGTRMVPVSTISGRLQRTVRQAGRTLERVVELTISGDDLLLDNDVLRAIADPLMHVLRNAVDHGIEAPAERETAGKLPAGQLQLSFRQEGNHVIAQICDDGRGIDYQALRDTAIARGMLDAQATYQPEQLRRLMLIPGFSTRSSATQVSGRGVGMDVVYTAVTALKGSLDVFDNPVHGCTVQLRLPVTLIANHCLLVEIAGKRLAVPSYTLERVIAPGVGELNTLSEALQYKLGKDVYPARHLHSLLGEHYPLAGFNVLAVVLVAVDQEVIAVTVDRVLEGRELVVKSIGKYIGSVPGVSGVSVLGDGSVVPVLDLPALLRKPVTTAITTPKLMHSDAGVRAHSVLIVDDSLSVRRALASLVEDTGYVACTARDGLEAIAILEERPIDIVLADLEMPRLNGLELTQYIRADENLHDLPVVMITSRGMGKHRRRAETAGVNVYLNKPVSNDDLLDLLDSLIEKHHVDASAA